jgi:hypothetical protein
MHLIGRLSNPPEPLGRLLGRRSKWWCDAGQVALVGLGHEGDLPLEALGADAGGHLLEKPYELGRRVAGEQPGKRGIEFRGGRREHLTHARDPGTHLLLGQRPLPTGVGVDEDQGGDEPGMVAVELLDEGAAPREPGKPIDPGARAGMNWYVKGVIGKASS